VAFLDASASFISWLGFTACAGCRNPKKGSPTKKAVAKMLSNATAALLLDNHFFVFTREQATETGKKAPKMGKLFAKAAFWQGYVIRDGFVPVRKMNHMRLAKPTSNKLFMIFADLPSLRCLFIETVPLLLFVNRM